MFYNEPLLLLHVKIRPPTYPSPREHDFNKLEFTLLGNAPT